MPPRAAGRCLRGAWRHFLRPEEGAAGLLEAPRSGPCGRGRTEAAGKGLRSFPGIPEGVNVWDRSPGAAAGPRPLAPPEPLVPAPPNPPPGPEGQRHQGDQTGLLRQRSPRTERDPLWATHQVEGSFHYFHRPRSRRRPEEGERRRRSTWRRTAGEREAATGRLLLSAPREPAEGAEGATTAPLPPPAPRARPLRRGHARVMTSHAVVQGGSEDGLWVGLREGESQADKHFSRAIFHLARSLSSVFEVSSDVT